MPIPNDMPAWQLIAKSGYSETYRMDVPGGYLYRYAWPISETEDGQCMVYVPAPAAPPAAIASAAPAPFTRQQGGRAAPLYAGNSRDPIGLLAGR
jgi:hypothetical protein